MPNPKAKWDGDLMERSVSATYNISQANWVLFGWLFEKCWKNCHFLSFSTSYSFVRICVIYLENSLLMFYFGFYTEKTIPIYISSYLEEQDKSSDLVISFTRNHPSFTQCSRIQATTSLCRFKLYFQIASIFVLLSAHV